MECKLCELIKNNRKMLIYEDELVVAFLEPKPASAGHIILFSKEHSPIMENCNDKIMSHLFVIANKLSSVLFESLNIQGTNIIVNNGVAAGQKYPHFCLNIIPRMENDNLKLQWIPTQVSEDDMNTAELKLNNTTKNLGVVKEEKIEVIKEPEQAEVIEEENYLVKHLRRLP